MIECERRELPRWNPWLITPNELEAQEQTLALINTEISGRLDRQSDSLGKIDGKAGLLLGYTIAASSFLSTRSFQPVVGGFAYACFGVAALAGVGALAVWSYQDIEPVPLIAHANDSPARLLAALISRRATIYNVNNGRQRWKAKAWWACLATVVVGSVLMVTSILVQTSHHDAAKPRGQQPAGIHASRPGGRSASSAN
jgi:hypothetical protein